MVRIVIDSASDIELEKAKELNLDFMPLKTIFGEDEYLDGGSGNIPTWSSCYEPKEKK